MTHDWTTDLPTESGFYWYRDDPTATPEVVEWDEDLRWMKFCGDDRAFERPGITGEFWPEKMNPPQPAGRSARAPLKTP